MVLLFFILSQWKTARTAGTHTHISEFMCEGPEPSWARPFKDSSLPAFVLALESASLELQEHKLLIEWAEGAGLAFPGQVLTLYYFL